MSGGFADLGLLPELLQAIDDLGWNLPTDIQDEAIPLILGGGDVMGAAETGSGKTAAFALPVIQSVYERLKTIHTSSRKRRLSDVETHIKLNPHDKDADLMLTSDVSCSFARTDIWLGVRATHGVNAGRYYYEAKVLQKGNCRVGWSTMSAHLELGKDKHGFGYGGKGWKSHDGQYEKYGGEYTVGDFIGCYVDLDNKHIFFSKNGQLLEKAYDIPESVLGLVLFPTIALSGGAIEVNFGAKPFQYPPSSDYTALNHGKHHLFDSDTVESYVKRNNTSPIAIIIEPTRDLAEQVYDNIVELSKYLTEPTLRTLLLIGDDNKTNVKQRLHQGIDIVVGTIGKIQGCIQSKQLDLSQIRFFILDEADKLTSNDNLSSIKQIYSQCPGGGIGLNRLQVCFFSATLHSPQIKELSSLICMNPTWIDLKGQETVLPETVHHVILEIQPQEHLQMMKSTLNLPSSITDNVHLPNDLNTTTNTKDAMRCIQSQYIKEIKPFLCKQLIDQYHMSQVMIFCRTNVDCQNLLQYFEALNNHPSHKQPGLDKPYSCVMLGSSITQEQRRQNLQLFKTGDIRLLICTDVAARGIDIDTLPYVINMTLPDEIDDYVHRIGRVGRNQRMGLAISIVSTKYDEKVWYHTCKSRGLNCQNRELTTQKGCTLWYSENTLLLKIEQKLQKSMLFMDSKTLELPDEIKALKPIYGEIINENEQQLTDKNQTLYMNENMIQIVKDLVTLEIQSQNMFLHLQQGLFDVKEK